MKQEFKNRLFNYLEENKAELEAWQKVKRLYKKDGTEFKNKNANFEGACFGAYYPVETALHPYLTVNYKYKYIDTYGTKTQYSSYSLQCYKDIRDLTEEEKQTKPITKRGTYYYDAWIFNYDEIEEAIKNHIKDLEEQIKDLEEQIKNIDFVLSFIDNTVGQIHEFVNKNSDKLQNKKYKFKSGNSLYYVMRDYLKAKTDSYNF